MRPRRLLPLVAATALLPVAALARAAGPQATTELDVFAARTTPGAPTEHVVDAIVAPGLGATQRLELYVPGGYTVALPAVGAAAGTAALTFRSGDGLVRVGGTLAAEDPAAHTADPCAPGPHAAVWTVAPAAAGQPPALTLYADPAPAALAGNAAYVVQACFDAPGTGGRQLASLRLDLRGVLTTPAASGRYVWRLLVTPYGTDGTPAPAPAAEAQALVPLPYQLTVRARYDAARKRVSFVGSAVAGRSPDAETPVQILVVTPAGLTPFGAARTDAKGRFAFAKRLTKTTRFALLAGAAAFSDCEPTLGPAPCARETLSPSELRVVSVHVPRT